MGYYDESGKLTIDEVAAQKDVKRLQEAVERLTASRDALKTVQRECTQMQGLAVNAISEKSQEMIVKLDAMITKMEATIYFINKTVKHYQQIDQDLKNAINSIHNAIDSVVHPDGGVANQIANKWQKYSQSHINDGIMIFGGGGSSSGGGSSRKF